LLRVDIARHNDRGVARPVPAFEEELRVVELVGHILDVRDEAHRGVTVGMGGVGVIALDFDELGQRVGGALVVFAEDCARASS